MVCLGVPKWGDDRLPNRSGLEGVKQDEGTQQILPLHVLAVQLKNPDDLLRRKKKKYCHRDSGGSALGSEMKKKKEWVNQCLG